MAEPYVLADMALRPPSAVVEPGQICRSLEGTDAAAPMVMSPDGVWGNRRDGSCTFVVGVYELPGQVTGRLLDAVPDLVVVRGGRDAVAGVELLITEFARPEPGQEIVLDRLVDSSSWPRRAGGSPTPATPRRPGGRPGGIPSWARPSP